jgi:hypothetical protein
VPAARIVRRGDHAEGNVEILAFGAEKLERLNSLKASELAGKPCLAKSGRGGG